MNIGIITPYDAANCGAYLQAYANKMFIESLGHKVFLIKWRSEQERKANFFPPPQNWKHRIRLIQQRGHHNRVYKKMTDALSEFDVIDYCDASFIDLFILGSDEIWNVSVPEFRNLIFYGKNSFNKRSLAYAPSISNSEYSLFDSQREIVECIRDLEIVGVRDSRTSELVASIKEEAPNMVCDPTLLLEIEQYKVPIQRIIPTKYIFVYSYFISSKYIDYLKHFAKRNGYKLVSACLYQSWCDINVACSPLEFISLIRDAECVFTATFHGAIFTLLNHKRCVIPTGKDKVKDLLNWTGMLCEVGIDEDTTLEDFCDLLNHDPDYEEFETRVRERRIYSGELYEEYLGRE